MRVFSMILVLMVLIVPCHLWGQSTPASPSAERLQQDARQLFEDLEAHREQMSQAKVDDLTLRLQADILTVWDRLLDQADEQSTASPQSPSPPNTPSSPSENSPENQSHQPPLPMGQQPIPDEATQPDESEGAAGQAPGQESDLTADESSEENRQRAHTRVMELKQAERERLMKEVWGKLPPQIRQKLLNASDEQYLPAYENRIRAYFRRLSDSSNP